MGVYTNLIVIVLAGYASASFLLPVEKCDLKDSACLHKAIQDAIPVFVLGLPEVGTDVLDVMDIPLVSFDLLGLQYTMTDAKLHGLRNVIIDDVKSDVIKNRLEIKYHVDCLIRGNYKARGKILIMPITGDGQCMMEMKNLSITWVLDYDIKKNPEGKHFIALTKYTVDFEVIENTHFEATNLFNGNKKLSDALLKFLNENWKEVTQKFGRPVIEISNRKMIMNVKKYLAASPLEDVAIYKV